MYYPPEVDQIGDRVCSMNGLVYITNFVKVYACQPTDESLSCLAVRDTDGAIRQGLMGGRNVWIIQWYGSRGAREALRYLGQFVGEGGVLAGERNGKIRTWSKEWLNGR